MYYEAIGGPKDLERAKEMLQSVADVHRADGKCYNYLGKNNNNNNTNEYTK